MSARSGSTRYGFSGGGAESQPDPEAPAQPARGALTVYGHDLHRPGVAGPPPAGSLPLPPVLARSSVPQPLASPPAVPSLPVAEASFRPSHVPSHSGKSKFPARAGFWGRRNSHGAIVPLTDPGLVPAGLIRWRQAILPQVAVVLASALLSFAAVMLVMKLREQPTPPAAPAVVPSSAAAVPRPAPGTPGDHGAYPPAPAARAALPRRAVDDEDAITPASQERRRPLRTRRAPRTGPGPDDPLPPRF